MANLENNNMSISETRNECLDSFDPKFLAAVRGDNMKWGEYKTIDNREYERAYNESQSKNGWILMDEVERINDMVERGEMDADEAEVIIAAKLDGIDEMGR